MIRAAILAIGLAFGSAGCGSVNDGQPRSAGSQAPVIRLEEESAQALPDSFVFGGANANGVHQIAWSVNQRFVLIRNGDEQPWRRLAIPAVGVLHAASVADSLIEVAAGTSVFRVSNAGHAVSSLDYRVPIRPVAATRLRGIWYIGGSDTVGAYRVFALKGPESQPVILVPYDSLVASSDDTTFFQAAHLASSDSLLVLTVVRPPHTTRVYDTVGTQLLSFAPAFGPATAITAGQPAADWASLSTLPLDCGYLQVLADLRSDRRRLLVYDAAGRLLRETEMDVPIGFVSSSPSGRRLVATRHLGTSEIVQYRWRWVGDYTPNGGQNSCKTD